MEVLLIVMHVTADGGDNILESKAVSPIYIVNVYKNFINNSQF
jgi:hypothetical protein